MIPMTNDGPREMVNAILRSKKALLWGDRLRLRAIQIPAFAMICNCRLKFHYVALLQVSKVSFAHIEGDRLVHCLSMTEFLLFLLVVLAGFLLIYSRHQNNGFLLLSVTLS